MNNVEDIAVVIVRSLRRINKELEVGLAEIEDLLGDSFVTELLGEGSGKPADASPSWTKVDELKDQTYQWPKKTGGLQEFDRFVVYGADGLKIGLGFAHSHGKEAPPEIGVFKLGARDGSKYPIVYFTATDDYDKTRELIAPIRGRAGAKSRAMFRPSDELPPPYDQFPVAAFRDKRHGYRFDIVGVVAKEDDELTMVKHGAAQIRRRGL
jgi:hypothetical protein